MARKWSMEEFGQNYGYILYRKRLETPAKGQLVLDDLRDQATVFADGRIIGRLDRRCGEKTLAVDLPVGTQLDLRASGAAR